MLEGKEEGLEMCPFRLNIIEEDNCSGYSKSTRNFGKALNKFMDVEFNAEPKEGFALVRPWFNNTRKFVGKSKIIDNIVLESSRLHPYLVKEANADFTEQVWCPSRFCAENYTNSGVLKDKINIIPHGVDIGTYKPVNKSDSSFTFIFVGGFTGYGDRKGADILCKAFNEEFKNDDAKLYIKINPVYGLYTDLLLPLVKDVKKKVIFNTVKVNEEHMNRIYNLGDCFVCPSMAEGFNMTCLEAMAVGLPVVTSFYGGHMDYLLDCNLIIQDGKFIPARYTPWDCGKWFEPDMGILKDMMRYMFDNPSECKVIGRKNLKEASKWSWEKAAKIAMEALKSS